MKSIGGKVRVEAGEVSVLTILPENPLAVCVLAHGAGAGMEHPFMKSLATDLASWRIATVRFNFLYMEQGKRRPDPAPVAERTVAAVLNDTHERLSNLPLFAGGKSFGGRMSSQLLSRESLPWVKGIVFVGFPLHPAGAPAITRAAHLSKLTQPMLFLHGTHDALADNVLMCSVAAALSGATLLQWAGADHSFKHGKVNLIPELAEKAAAWMNLKRG